MHELALFLGHFHPVWVHLPIGILLLLALLELAGQLARARFFTWLPVLAPRQRTLIVVISAAASVVAAALGWLLARGGDYDPVLVHAHKWLGFAAAAAAVVLGAVHRVRWAYPAALAFSVALLTLASHAGGQISHGSDFLTSHMPAALGRFLRLAPAEARAAPVDFDRALVFSDVVQPILRDRCITCHGGAKASGGLRLDSWELLAKGGKHGPVLKAADPTASELVRRVELPLEEKEHMAPRGKPQLSGDDLTLLEWWVGIGAPRDQRIAELDLPSAVDEALDARVGGRASRAPPDRAATLAQARPLEARLGILIRSLSADGPWLDVNARPAGRAFGNAQLAALAPLAGAIRWLDLGGTGVTDSGLAGVEAMRRLERLHLDQLAVTNAGLAHLSRLKRLRYLNLRGTRVSDAGLTALRSLSDLRALYTWQTDVTPAAVKALGDALVNQRRIALWKAQGDELARKIQAEHFQGDTGDVLAPPAPRDPPAKQP